MFFALEKFRRRAEELAERRYVLMQSISPLTAMEDTLDNDTVHTDVPEVVNGYEFKKGDAFVGRDRYLWLEKQVSLPKARSGFEVIGRFNFGTSGGGGNSSFESMLYIEGKPYQGVDTNHNDVVFEKLAGQTVRMNFLLWTGLEGGGPKREQYHVFKEADIGYLHKETDDLYYLTRAVTEVLYLMPEESPVRHQIEAAMEHALLLINWDEDTFLDTVGPALALLKKELSQIESTTDVTARVVGHSHIDVAWLWRLKHTREKAQRTFATVLRYMDEFDEYIFMHSSPQVYKDLKKDNPYLYEGIRKRVKEGRWEPGGGMWLEADCNVTSGESLTRQFLYGIRFFEKEFGIKCTYLWLPDVFGYSWALPQIMKLAGIKTFMTTKISWNQFNSIPHDVFHWRGIDGSEVLTYFIDVPNEPRDIKERFSTYNGNISSASVMGGWKKFKDKEISHNYLISYGHGDGGGGVDHDMLKMRRALDQIPGIPNVKPTRADDFFDQLHKDVEKADEVAVWDGELYLEYHRGTYTSQSHNKRFNRKAEFALAEAEWMSVLAASAGLPYDHEVLDKSWETVLELQFHDIIPGSSIREVYEDSDRMYAKVFEDVGGVMDTAAGALAVPGADHAVTLYHFGSFFQTPLVFLNAPGQGVFKDGGTVLEAQPADGGYMVKVPLAPLEVKTLRFVPFETAKQTQLPFLTISDGTDIVRIETPHYTVELDAEHFISRLYDKDCEREVLAGRANVLEVFENKPINYDNWDIDIFYTQKKEYFKPAGPVEVLEEGTLRLVLGFKFVYHLSMISQRMILYRDDRRIDFETHIDWHEDHRLLKMAVESNIRSTKATYDIQYGHVERPTHFNTSWDWAKFEVVGHKWGDLSEQNYGLSILNDCKYGYNAKDSTIKLTLLKCGTLPDTEADIGEHDVLYALYPHAAGPVEGGTIQAAEALNLPPVVKTGSSSVTGSLFVIEGDGIHIDAVKQAEDSEEIVLRVHECYGGTKKVSISSAFGIKEYTEVNLLEEALAETVNAAVIERTLKPFEIVTWKIRMESCFCC